MIGKYASFDELARHEVHGGDYKVHALERSASPVLIIAPHGGSIEIGTSELATLVADAEHNLFTFDGLKIRGENRTLHITSHQFDHPVCVEMAQRCAITLAIHGCRGESQICVGGLDEALKVRLSEELTSADLPVTVEGHQYPGRHPQNICNRNARGCGAQLEFTNDFRTAAARALIAPLLRSALARHVADLAACLHSKLTSSYRT